LANFSWHKNRISLFAGMRVLHIALNNLRQDALCDALASLGPYREIDWIAEINRKGLEDFRSDLIASAVEFQPDLVFMQLQTPGVINPATAGSLPGFRVNWTGDVRQPIPQWYIDLGKAIDLSLFTNTADVDAMRAQGAAADYLQIGFDPDIFNRGSTPINKTQDVVFMGTYYRGKYPLSGLRHEMVQRLHEELKYRFALYGFNWDLPADAIQHNTPEESAIYRRAKIGINLSHFDLGRYSSDRIHSIIGSGTFCLTKWYPDIELEFEPGKHVAVWHTLDELVEKVNYYLEHEDEREAIAAAGYRLVHERDTWGSRIKELEAMVESKIKN
jgi:spore maturation protein CgeB